MSRCTCRLGRDPMRQIDLVFLEDVMKRYPVEVSTTASAFQIAGLVCAMLAVLGLLVHDMVYRDPSATARAPATQMQQPTMMP
jgi:hypothetical protein